RIDAAPGRRPPGVEPEARVAVPLPRTHRVGPPEAPLGVGPEHRAAHPPRPLGPAQRGVARDAATVPAGVAYEGRVEARIVAERVVVLGPLRLHGGGGAPGARAARSRPTDAPLPPRPDLAREPRRR